MSVESIITENLGIWTSAIKTKSASGRGSSKKLELYGIKKLRELILDLAVHGKLVPQDPKDKPARELIEQISLLREKKTLTGELKAQKKAKIHDSELKFDSIPNGWSIADFGDLTFNLDYKRVPLSVSEREGRKGTYDYYGASGVIDSIDSYLFEKSLLLIGEDGANLVNRSTPIAFIAKGKYWVNNHAHVIDGISESFLNYLALYINSISLMPYITGMAQPKMNQAKMNAIRVLLPPENEQVRIIKKVDELMALCDQLESQTEASIESHQTLVKSLLETLTNAKDADELNESWQRISAHFDVLFTTEDSIEQLKQTILQLAVMGKLVKQDPNDEPASKLLERIAVEKEKLIKDKKIKKQKPLPSISEDEIPFQLPHGWEWCRLPDIGDLNRGKSKHRPRNDKILYEGGTIPLVQTGDVARANGVVTTFTSLYNQVGVEQSRLWPKGTLCITIAANIADTAVLGFDACFPDSVVGFTPYLDDVDVKYIDYYLRTAKGRLEEFAPSTAQKNINLEILSNLLVPLPPKKKILDTVRMIETLFSIVEKLSDKFTLNAATNLKLADSLCKDFTE